MARVERTTLEIGDSPKLIELSGLRPTNWWIITGGPSSGKTTLLEDLGRSGYNTMPEAARVFIDSEMAKGRTVNAIRRSEFHFQNAVLKLKIATEDSTPEDKLILWDRGIDDTWAYLAQNGTYDTETFPEEHYYKVERKYRKVFLLDLLPYENDYARIEDERQARRIHSLIRDMYEHSGYDVVRVPVFSRPERAEFVIDKMREVDPSIPKLPYIEPPEPPVPTEFQLALSIE